MNIFTYNFWSIFIVKTERIDFTGNDVIQWLGKFTNMGPAELSPSAEPQNFPIKPSEKRSYAQNCVVWIRQSGLQVRVSSKFLSF